MISGLRDQWEGWAELEARNRRDAQNAFAYACRVAPDCNLLAAEVEFMGNYALCVEAFLNQTARACGGERADLDYSLRTPGLVTWREHHCGQVEVKIQGAVWPVEFRWRSSEGETHAQAMARIREQAK